MPDHVFTPASEYTTRHGLFIALVGGTNSGKTYSGLRLAKGIAEPQGKRIAVLDTEGGRTLHLRKTFDFDLRVLEPPHRPERYLEVAQSAQDKGYGVLLIDSFSMEWRGIGGKLDWTDQKLEEYVAKKKANAEQYGDRFDEDKTRLAGKAAASIEPSMSHKLMELGMLGLRIPIIFCIRGSETFDPKVNKAVFKAQCRQDFLFDVTVSFRLASDKKGIIDLSDAKTWKMEGDHAAIFKNGEQLCERHGELVNAWAINAPLPDAASAKPFKWAASTGAVSGFVTAEEWSQKVAAGVAKQPEDALAAALERNRAELEAHLDDAPEAVSAIFKAFADRGVPPKTKTESTPTREAEPKSAAAADQTAASEADPKPIEEEIGPARQDEAPPQQDPPAASSWLIDPTIVGMEPKIAALTKLALKADTPADIDAIESENAEFIGKTGRRQSDIKSMLRNRRAILAKDAEA